MLQYIQQADGLLYLAIMASILATLAITASGIAIAWIAVVDYAALRHQVVLDERDTVPAIHRKTAAAAMAQIEADRLRYGA